MNASAEEPMIGALLRFAWQVVRERVLQDLHAAGFDDLSAAHLSVLQHPAPRGVRPIDLANRAGTTKQAMNHLIAALEGSEYLERRDDPDRAGGRLVWLTARGEKATKVIRRTIEGLEAEWTREIGTKRFSALKGTLRELASNR